VRGVASGAVDAGARLFSRFGTGSSRDDDNDN
jgi:hypothetical protein